MEGQPNAPSPPRTAGLSPQMRLQINNMANELQGLISLIYMPNQTQDQANAGEYNFLQLRSTVNELHKTLAGDTANGVLSFQQMRDHTKQTAPIIPNLEKGQIALLSRVEKLENTLEPILLKADETLKGLQQQAEILKKEVSSVQRSGTDSVEHTKEVVEKEIGRINMVLKEQETNHDQLLSHAKSKFDELEATHDTLIGHIKTTFDEIRTEQQAVVMGAKDKFDGLDAKYQQVEAMVQRMYAMRDQDIEAIRAKLAQQGMNGEGHGFNPFHKTISEYKAIANLERYTSEQRVGYKAWLRKL